MCRYDCVDEKAYKYKVNFLFFRFTPMKLGMQKDDSTTQWRDDSSEVSDEGYKSQGNNTLPRPPPTKPRKMTPRRSLDVESMETLGMLLTHY